MATSKETVCYRCGRPRRVISSGGRPLCGSCYNVSPDRPRRRCGRCNKVAAICVRATSTSPDICVDCYELPLATCSSCGRHRPCQFVALGTPTCKRCLPRATSICAHCGADRPPAVNWAEGPVCDTCYTATLRRRGICNNCRQERRLVSPPGPGSTMCCDCAGLAPLPAHICRLCGREDKCYERSLCDRCVLSRRSAELMTGPDGKVAPALLGVHNAIISSATPRKALNWLRQGAGAPILAAMAAGTMAMTHEALDAHPQTGAANYLRSMLVASGAKRSATRPLAPRSVTPGSRSSVPSDCWTGSPQTVSSSKQRPRATSTASSRPDRRLVMTLGTSFPGPPRESSAPSSRWSRGGPTPVLSLTASSVGSSCVAFSTIPTSISPTRSRGASFFFMPSR